MEPESSLPLSQQPATSPCPQSDQSTPRLSDEFLQDRLLTLSSLLHPCLFPPSFPPETLHAPLFSPTRATCPAHLIMLDVITLTICCDAYRSGSNSLFNSFYSPLTLSPVDPKHLPQHPVLEHPQPMLLPQSERPSFTPIQNNRQNNCSFYFNVCISGEQTGRKKGSTPKDNKHCLAAIYRETC